MAVQILHRAVPRSHEAASAAAYKAAKAAFLREKSRREEVTRRKASNLEASAAERLRLAELAASKPRLTPEQKKRAAALRRAERSICPKGPSAGGDGGKKGKR